MSLSIFFMYIIQTERLKLRQLTVDDVHDLEAIFSDPTTMQHYTSTKDTAATKQWIERNKESYQKHGFGLWAVIRKDSDQFIGDCGITMQIIDGEEHPEIGYHIRRDHWGQGYATEAAQACKDYAFNVLHLKEVFSYMRSENIASRKVAENIGMVLRKEYVNKGHATVAYSVKKEE